LELFFVIVKKLRDVHFIVSVCSFACFLLGVGVRVSCCVVSSLFSRLHVGVVTASLLLQSMICLKENGCPITEV